MIRALAILLLFASPAAAHTVECGLSADAAPQWDEKIALACAGPDRTVDLTEGVCKFDTRPAPIACDGITVVGTGTFTTHLQRTYTPADDAEPFIELRGRGSRLAGFEIQAKSGTSGGFGLLVSTDNALPGGKHHIEHVRISGEVVNGVHSATWKVALRLDGVARTQNPKGLRAVNLFNVEVFDATAWLVTVRTCHACGVYGAAITQGGGTAKGVNVYPDSTNLRLDGMIDWSQSSIPAASMRGPGR